MRRSSIAAATLFAALAVGCSNQGRSGTSFNFSRPEMLSFLCMARVDAPGEAEYVPVPRGCCGELDPSRSADAPPLLPSVEACTTDGARRLSSPPVLHALISQSARGELAAVDLKAERVLDSNRVVPGSTFIDIGGLPTGLVTPAQQPLSPTPRGPLWTYVASGEDFHVRAVANCRFRQKVGCGPEADQPGTYATRTRVALPAAPGDMVLAPAGTAEEALWVTLPELGLIARIELSRDPARPFAVGPGDVPLAPRFYRVPAPSTVEAPLPVSEEEPYLAVCGLGTNYVPAALTLPLAPRVAGTGALRPTRLRFDTTSGLLLVADAASPVLHVFAPGAEGALTSLGALPTGVPLHDFVLTPYVPARAPNREQLYTPALPAVPAEDRPRRRYLYGIEERGDGMVAVFDFATAAPGALPTLTPLLAPDPEERYADRIKLNAPATALEVVDTRPRSAYVCGEQSDAELADMIATLRDADQVDTVQLARLEERLDISQEADTEQLRGVFVTVASANGLLTIIDVQDLDLACRARDECAMGSEAPLNPDAQSAVAVRRHAVRQRSAGDVTATVSGADGVLVPTSCSPDRWPALTSTTAPAGANALVCVPRDPWSTLNEVWAVRYQGALPSGRFVSGALEFPGAAHPPEAHVPAPGAGLVTLHAPEGVNLCSRGLQVGDLVAITGAPAERAEDCETPTSTSARLLEVREAFDDGVLLAVRPEEGEDVGLVLDELRRCYPDSVGFELRAAGYIVTGSTTAVGAGATANLHPVVTAPDGRCEVDASKDPRLTARPTPIVMPGSPGADSPGFRPDADYQFENPYVSFTLARRGAGGLETARDITVQVRNSAVPLTQANTDGRIRDALPVALRYLPEVGDLFVVDTASQGLRRYEFRPFAWDRQFYR